MTRVRLKLTDLHGSVSDPLLDSMTFLNEVAQRYPSAISFAPGRPYEGFFDTGRVPELYDAYLDRLRDAGRSDAEIRRTVFQYGETAGLIRDQIAELMRVDEGVDVAPGSIVVTVGAQEALLLTLRALCAEPDDVLLVDSPCYVGVTGAARLLGIPVVPVPGGEDGVRLDDLERTVRRLASQGRRARALYVVPDCSNPSGASMSGAARTALLDAAERHDLLVLEDNPYGLFSEERLPTLKALDPYGRVVYLGSTAKSAFPGARIGWVIADQPVDTSPPQLLADQLTKIKSMVTLNTPSITQAVIGGLLHTSGGGLRAANAAAARHYRDGMRRLRAALAKELGDHPGVTWNEPNGGFFLTLTVPFAAEESALRRCAERHRVIWTPLRYFHLDDAGDRQIRLSCSSVSGDEIEEGVARLAAFVREEA